MRARFTIEASDNDGVGAWVRPIDAGEPTYWKWYQDAHHAMIDVNEMGLGSLEMIQSSDPRFAIGRRSVPIEITIEPERLELALPQARLLKRPMRARN